MVMFRNSKSLKICIILKVRIAFETGKFNIKFLYGNLVGINNIDNVNMFCKSFRSEKNNHLVSEIQLETHTSTTYLRKSKLSRTALSKLRTLKFVRS